MDSLKLIMARLAHGAATSISLSFLVMFAEKILRCPLPRDVAWAVFQESPRRNRAGIYPVNSD
jgi:hypothetical protein